MAWWGTKDKLSPRFVTEAKAMRQHFGDRAKLVVPQNGATPSWMVTVDINLKELDKNQREHTIQITYSSDYPNQAPIAKVVNPRISSSRHQYHDDRLCLFNPHEGRNHGWNPSKGTVLTIALWSVQWIYSYYTWTYSGLWPGDEEITQGSQENRHRDLSNPRSRLESFRRD